MKIAVTAAVLIILILLRSIYEIHHFKIKRYKIEGKNIHRDITFAFISDLHNCAYGKENIEIINAVKHEKPEFLIIGGDMIKGKREIQGEFAEKYFDNAVDFLNGMCGDFPVLYVYGNHETRTKSRRKTNPIYDEYIKQISTLIKEQKIKILNNDIWQSESVKILGIEVNEAAYKDRKQFDEKSLKELMEKAEQSIGSENDTFKILVSHTPEFFDEYVGENIDLVLSGHNHGGIVRLPFVGGIVSRNYRLFPKYSYGLYEKNGKKMILTAGLGDHTLRFRLFNKPEIVIITLTKKD